MNSRDKRAAERRIKREMERPVVKSSMAHFDPTKRRVNRRLHGATNPYFAFLGMVGRRGA